MIESSLAVPTFVQYLQTLQYSIFPSELTLSLAWHFGHIFSRFVTNPPWISIFKLQDQVVKTRRPKRCPDSTQRAWKNIKQYGKTTDPNLEVTF